jgi:hypothetical protein
MAKQTINIGTVANDGTGDPLRTAFDKVNDNFTEVYGFDDSYDVQVISTSTNAVKNTLYVFTADLTLTLPSSPTNSDSIKISNLSGVDTCVLGRNGNNIMGTAEDLTLDTASASFELIYSGATKGWVIVGL